MIYRHRFRVGYRDTDQMGFMHHSCYLVYMESARTEMLRATGSSYREWEEAGYLLPLTGCGLDFQRAAKYDDAISLETRIDSLTRLRMKFAYRFIREGEEGKPLAMGYTEHLFMDRSNRPRRLDPDRMAGIERLVMAAFD